MPIQARACRTTLLDQAVPRIGLLTVQAEIDRDQMAAIDVRFLRKRAFSQVSGWNRDAGGVGFGEGGIRTTAPH